MALKIGSGFVGLCGAVFCLRSFFNPVRGNRRPRTVEEARQMLEEDAAKAGYDSLSIYLHDLNLKDPAYLKVISDRYHKCAVKYGNESERCSFYKSYWMASKKAQNGS